MFPGKLVTEEEHFEDLMTDEEKEKLFDALGYESSVGDPTLPPEVWYFLSRPVKTSFRCHARAHAL